MSAIRRVASMLSLAWLSLKPVRAETLDSFKRAVRKRFPGVRQVSTEELARWLADKNRGQPVLVDARKKEAFDVSHLHSARNLTTAAQVKSVLAQSSPPPVIVYCSVGYRSSALVEKLQSAGSANVMSLEGSLFQWANEGRPLYRGTNQVSEVHGYSRKWSGLLKPSVPVKL